MTTARQKRCMKIFVYARQRVIHLRRDALALAFALPWTVLFPSATSAQAATASSLQMDTEIALQQLTRGNLTSAAKRTRMALQAAPGDATLYLLAGTVLLNGNDARGAVTAFDNALACDSTDGLAFYGLALAQLGCGDRAAAAKKVMAGCPSGRSRFVVGVTDNLRPYPRPRRKRTPCIR